jgi:CDP-paratose 2-epimerase
MSIVIVTGSGGLIGSETVAHYCALGCDVIGVDNDMRARFFGADASTAWLQTELKRRFRNYRHVAADIRDRAAIDGLFASVGTRLSLVVHTAAQPSHDWAATDPEADFSINATGTHVLLEATRQHSPDAVFVFMSTNKVYGDTPNRLPLVERESRWEVDPDHKYSNGIDESMSIDATTHSLFGASKVAADVLVQEYGRYFGMKTACFRGGCLTGPNHSGAMLHGFLAYLLKCVCTGTPYTVFGHKAKQVRDHIHSADVIAAIHQVFLSPRQGAVYNLGGSRFSHCSILEGIAVCEQIAERPLRWSYQDVPRIGDHIWYVSDTAKLASDYPSWRITYSLPALVKDIYERNVERWLWQGATT